MHYYHMSETLKIGDGLVPDYKRGSALVTPFVQSLHRSEDCFYGMYLSAKYMWAVLGKFSLREWSDYVKWSCEGIFEYIRQTEYPDSVSRIRCNYYYDNLENVRTLYAYDWGEASEEERSAIHLFEVDLADPTPQIRDMRLYDMAYDALLERDDVATAMESARRYFAGACTDEPVWEILSDQPSKAIKDLTELLHSPA